MIELSDFLGFKRIALIEGFGQFSVTEKSIELIMKVQIINTDSTLLLSNNINQNRYVRYRITNENFVDANFNPVQSDKVGSKAEYDYFFQLMQTTALPALIIQLANKLKSRGIFN